MPERPRRRVPPRGAPGRPPRGGAHRVSPLHVEELVAGHGFLPGVVQSGVKPTGRGSAEEAPGETCTAERDLAERWEHPAVVPIRAIAEAMGGGGDERTGAAAKGPRACEARCRATRDAARRPGDEKGEDRRLDGNRRWPSASPVTRMAGKGRRPAVPAGTVQACNRDTGWRSGRIAVAEEELAEPEPDTGVAQAGRRMAARRPARAGGPACRPARRRGSARRGVVFVRLRELQCLFQVALRDLPVLQEGEDERTRRAVKDAGDEVVESIFETNASLRVSRPSSGRPPRLLPLEVAFLREEAEHRRDRRVGDGRRKDVVDLLHQCRRAEAPRRRAGDCELNPGSGALARRIVVLSHKLSTTFFGCQGRGPDAEAPLEGISRRRSRPGPGRGRIETSRPRRRIERPCTSFRGALRGPGSRSLRTAQVLRRRSRRRRRFAPGRGGDDRRPPGPERGRQDDDGLDHLWPAAPRRGRGADRRGALARATPTRRSGTSASCPRSWRCSRSCRRTTTSGSSGRSSASDGSPSPHADRRRPAASSASPTGDATA